MLKHKVQNKCVNRTYLCIDRVEIFYWLEIDNPENRFKKYGRINVRIMCHKSISTNKTMKMATRSFSLHGTKFVRIIRLLYYFEFDEFFTISPFSTNFFVLTDRLDFSFHRSHRITVQNKNKQTLNSKHHWQHDSGNDFENPMNCALTLEIWIVFHCIWK